MKSLTKFLKESFFSDSEKAPEIVTKHLGLKYATGEGNSESQYTICGEKSYVERGKVEGQDNVFVTVGWYSSLLRKDASIFVYTTAKANSAAYAKYINRGNLIFIYPKFPTKLNNVVTTQFFIPEKVLNNALACSAL